MGNICILCAIRQETRPLLKHFPATRAACLADFPAWCFQAYGHSVTLLESGTGVTNAGRAAKAAAAMSPDLIISAGFCGALTAEVAVGEVFLADHLYAYSSGLITSEITPDGGFADQIGPELKRGSFITAAEITDKAHLHSLLPEPTAFTMIEMESSAVAAVCRDANIRFIALRSVSDTADHDPGKLFQQICDNQFNVRMTKVVLSLIRKPALLAEYVQLYRNTVHAGATLSKAIASTLERF